MYFVIGTVEFFEKLGYNTRYWKKTTDGNKTICHLEYAEILANNLSDNSEVKIVDATEAREIVSGEEWIDEKDDLLS